MQIDRAATSTLAASTSYARFQNGLSKAIVRIRKPLRSFSTGGQFVAGRCLYSNEVNNVKDSFLPCEASALFQQVEGLDTNFGLEIELCITASSHYGVFKTTHRISGQLFRIGAQDCIVKV